MVSTNTLFAIQIIIDGIIPLIQTQFVNKQATTSMIVVFGIAMLCSVIMDIEYDSATARESNRNRKDFIESSLRTYSKLSQSDRESAGVDVFKRVQSKKEDTVGLQSWFKLSFKMAISMLVTMISTMFIVGTIWPLIYLSIMYAVVFKFIKKQMHAAKEVRMQNREMAERYKKQDDFQYQKIRIGQGSIDSIMARKDELLVVQNKKESEWKKLFLLCSIPIIVASTLSMFHQKDGHMNLVLLCTIMLKSIGFISAFFNTYEESLAKADEYAKYWDGKRFTKLPEQYPIKTIKILEYEFKDRNLVFKQPLVLSRGSIISLTGKTGAGKTTFINALKGVCSGMKLSKYEPLNHFTYISHLRQDIRGAYHFSNISLSELFDTTSKTLILEVLEVVNLMEWFEDIGDIFADINNRISGGQKTQLCLAITIFEGVGKQLLILDEPEQGLHPELIPDIIGNVFKWLHTKNPDLIIIFISHVCGCVAKCLPKHIRWHIIRDKNDFRLDILNC
jgi:ABC-type transport system involved in cytochrome bd biosynthesis fused ATPase/permease subunit